MKLEINITKTRFWGLTIIAISLAAVIILAAGEGKSNPGHSAEEVEGTVPSSFCVFSSQANICPQGFTKSERFNGNTIRGINSNPSHDTTAVNLNEQGGVDSYGTNGEAWSSGGDEQSNYKLINVGNANEIKFNNWPPYVGVLICCKD